MGAQITRNLPIRTVELFAGVGGFRVGLEKSSNLFQTIWANQWEPNKKVQHAYDCYVSHFGESENHVNLDIAIAKEMIPEHDLLVGGFPCQDYSVARTGATGIEGKKGVLWWDIRAIAETHRPSYILLENVDRLLKSPAKQRGRDFGIILRCLHELGYAVEWRVINAAEYGCAQRRRRVFILAYQKGTPLYQSLAQAGFLGLESWIKSSGFYAKAFPVLNERNSKKRTSCPIDESNFKALDTFSDFFSAPLFNAGVMFEGNVYSEELQVKEQRPITLGEVRHQGVVDARFFLNGSFEKWEFLKGAKKIDRIKPNGEPYVFSEGGMCFPDYLDKPARTMLTSESSVNRSTHVIEDAQTARLRLLTPVECERLNGFEDDWTNTGMPEKFRYFTMGNALVVPIITRIGNRLLEII